MERHCMAWNGMAWHGVAWHGMAWHDVAWRGVALHGMAAAPASLLFASTLACLRHACACCGLPPIATPVPIHAVPKFCRARLRCQCRFRCTSDHA